MGEDLREWAAMGRFRQIPFRSRNANGGAKIARAAPATTKGACDQGRGRAPRQRHTSVVRQFLSISERRDRAERGTNAVRQSGPEPKAKRGAGETGPVSEGSDAFARIVGKILEIVECAAATYEPPKLIAPTRLILIKVSEVDVASGQGEGRRRPGRSR